MYIGVGSEKKACIHSNTRNTELKNLAISNVFLSNSEVQLKSGALWL